MQLITFAPIAGENASLVRSFQVVPLSIDKYGYGVPDTITNWYFPSLDTLQDNIRTFAQSAFTFVKVDPVSLDKYNPHAGLLLSLIHDIPNS